jgi:hypothetical protein
MGADQSSNRQMVTLRTIAAEIRCTIRKAAEKLARWGGSHQRVKARTGPPGGLSRVISAAYGWGLNETRPNGLPHIARRSERHIAAHGNACQRCRIALTLERIDTHGRDHIARESKGHPARKGRVHLAGNSRVHLAGNSRVHLARQSKGETVREGKGETVREGKGETAATLVRVNYGLAIGNTL